MGTPHNGIDHVVFETNLVRIGAFRCHPEHPSFHDSGPIKNYCFVFPRTAVKIQHEHEPVFVANPNVVTFYNLGQLYLRHAISPTGDHCDWFGIDPELARDVVRAFDTHADDHSDRPFPLSRGWSDPPAYLLQRRLFTQVTSGKSIDPLAVEETVIELLDRVIRCTYSIPISTQDPRINKRQRDAIHDIEAILSRTTEQRLTLKSIAGQVGLSAYHVCRLFRRVTGIHLHQYRLRLRLREALADVVGSGRSLTDVALDAGFSSHSHFTDLFHREFSATPSSIRLALSQRLAAQFPDSAPLPGSNSNIDMSFLMPFGGSDSFRTSRYSRETQR